MGSTNKTTNLELSQFLGTDKPSWLNDYNADMLAIDTAVGTNVTDISTAQSRADSAYTLADNTASSVSSLSTQVSSNTTDIATAQGNITTINSLIGNGTPTTTDQTIIGAINEINGKVSSYLYSNAENATYATACAAIKSIIDAYTGDKARLALSYDGRLYTKSGIYFFTNCTLANRGSDTPFGNRLQINAIDLLGSINSMYKFRAGVEAGGSISITGADESSAGTGTLTAGMLKLIEL